MVSWLKGLLRRIVPQRVYKTLVWLRYPDRFDLFHGPVTYNSDGIASRYATGFRDEARFKKAVAAAATAMPPGKSKSADWTSHVVFWAAEVGRRLEGDFVECGVHYGYTARGIMEYVGFENSGKTFWLCDTFSGLDAKQISEKEKRDGVLEYLDEYDDFWAIAQRNFVGFSFVRLIRGPVPDTLPDVTAKKIAFLHLDMNCAAPSLAAAEYFWPKMSVGAVLLLDDYGSPIHDAQKEVFDGFARDHGVGLLCLPTGQGLIIKA
jgi:O-methyltransferase